jgi:hypothetical protein
MRKGQQMLTPVQYAEALRLYHEVLSVRTVVARTGLSRQQVYGVLRREGIHPSGESGGACYRNLPTLRSMLAAGATFAEVARAIGTTHGKVGKFVRKHSIPHTPWTHYGSQNPNWKGGRMIDPDGYVLIRRPDHPHASHKYVREHRLVMEEHLGRFLLPTEVVHHRDSDKQNNVLSNLELFDSNGAHLAHELKGRTPNWTPDGWARILAKSPRQRGLGRKSTQRP